MEYKHIDSNAVLTPHLNNPKAISGEGGHVRNPHMKNKTYLPLKPFEVRHRKAWCVRQAYVLSQIPSNAVLIG